MAFVRLEIKTKGVRTVERALEKYGKEAEESITAVLLQNAQRIAANAQSRAPRDTGKLERSIRSGIAKQQGPLAVRVYSSVFYAPYQEFGTGRGARSYVPTLPTEWQRMAQSARGVGGSTNPNITPKKFLWNAVIDNQPLIISSLRTQLEILDLR